MAYSKPDFRKFIPIFMASTTISSFESIPPPEHSSYNLAHGFDPLRKSLQDMISFRAKEIDDIPANQLIQINHNETMEEFLPRRRRAYLNILELKTSNAADDLMMQWKNSPSSSPRFSSGADDWFKTKQLVDDIQEYFSSCARNRDLRSFISRITEVLQANHIDFPLKVVQTPIFHFLPQFEVNHCPSKSLPFTLENLFIERGHPAPDPAHKFGIAVGTTAVEKLISKLRRNLENSALANLYSTRLENSVLGLHRHKNLLSSNNLPGCLAYRDSCRIRLKNMFSLILSALYPSTMTERILAEAGLWPRIHHRALLHPLASTAHIRLSPDWTECLIKFAELFIEYQYSQRLVSYAHHSQNDSFDKELINAAFSHSDAVRYPDWLLIQVINVPSFLWNSH
jgi:hypothetical protein